MTEIADSIVWATWAFVLALTHVIGYFERKRLFRVIDAQRRTLARQHDLVKAHEAWRVNVASFLGMLRETAPEPIRSMAAQLIPPDIRVTAVDVVEGAPSKAPVH